MLVIDDDVGTRESFGEALRRHGLQVMEARSGAEGLEIVRQCEVDTVIVDLQLPDILGIEFVRLLRREGHRTAFILISAFLTVPITVEAMRLGAISVMEKPIELEDLLTLFPSPAPSVPVLRQPVASSAQPRSSAERWATYAIRACKARGDLKTLEEWAKFVGVSYSTLCESCRLLGIRPHDARDLVRLLRAIMNSALHHCPPEVLLDISDRRTLKLLLKRAGLEFDSRAWTLSIDDFLRRQQFVPETNEGLSMLRALLASSRDN